MLYIYIYIYCGTFMWIQCANHSHPTMCHERLMNANDTTSTSVRLAKFNEWKIVTNENTHDDGARLTTKMPFVEENEKCISSRHVYSICVCVSLCNCVVLSANCCVSVWYSGNDAVNAGRVCHVINICGGSDIQRKHEDDRTSLPSGFEYRPENRTIDYFQPYYECTPVGCSWCVSWRLVSVV